MKKMYFIFTMILFLTLTLTAFSQEEEKFIYKDNMRIDAKTNVPVSIYNVNSRQYSGTPEEISRQYLLENIKFLGLKDNLDDLKITGVKESPAGYHVGLIQNYKGVPVMRSEMVISINKQNRISMVISGYKPNISVNIIPGIDKDQALQLAKKSIDAVNSKEVFPPRTDLMVYEDSLNVFHLVWKFIIFPLEQGGEWLVVLDAHSGSILEKINTESNYVNGKGRIFDPDPGTYLNNASLTDQNDADYAEIQPAYKNNVTLNELNDPVGGVYRIQGRYAWSMQLGNPLDPQVTATHPDSFSYKRNQNGFEEVNCYYFLDKQRRYIGSLGFYPEWDFVTANPGAIAFDARGMYDRDALYSFINEYIQFGVPASYVDAGEDQCVILHEYGHALLDALVPDGADYRSAHMDGVSEGLADYLAISYRRTTQTNPYRPNHRNNWFIPDEGESIFSPENAKYPDHWGTSPYDKMKVWASTLMDMEYITATDPSAGTRLGRDITTKLVLTSLSYVSQYAHVIDNVHAILQADRDIYDGAHLATLVNIFLQRGFFYNNKVSGTITSNTTWSKYKEIIGNVTVNSGVTLTISPNTFLFFDNGKSLIVNGSLVANGTSTKPITFTSASPSPAAGDWNYVKLKGGPNTLKYCNFNYGVYGVYVNNTSTNAIENCTFHNSRDYGVTAYNTSSNINDVLVKNCAIINDNGSGICVQNATVTLNNTTISNNPGWGICHWSGGKTYMGNNSVASNTHDGIWVNGSTAYARLTPDNGLTRGYNTVSNNGDDQIFVLAGGAFLGETYSGQPKGGYNTINGNYYWVDNRTTNTIMAQWNYWGSCPPPIGSLYGPVDASNCLPLGGQTMVGNNPPEGSAPERMSVISSDPPLLAVSDARAIIQELKSRINIGTEGEARDAIHQLSGLVGPGGEYTNELGIKWEDYLQEISNSHTLNGVQSLALAYIIQSKMSQMDFDGAINLASGILKGNPDDELWLHCQFEIVSALTSKGDIESAEAAYERMHNRGMVLNPIAISRLKEIIELEKGNIGTISFSKLHESTLGIKTPTSLMLAQNYPNPFNPSTIFQYDLPEACYVTLKIYNALGQEIVTVVDRMEDAGYKVASFNATNLPSGVYIYRLMASTSFGYLFTDVKKMILMK